MISLFNQDNMEFETEEESVDLIYADMIYESLDFGWVDKYWSYLKKNGIFIVQTDYHSVADIKVYLDGVLDSMFVNWLTWKNEFGNFRKDRFRQCHDDILIFSKGENYLFQPDKVQIPKVTAKSKGLNKSGRTTKIATSVITDICLTTIAKERIHKDDGHCLKWQKPLELLKLIFSPWLKEGMLILDPFMGSGTSGIVAQELGCNYIGIEYDPEVFVLAQKRLHDYGNNL